METQELVQEVIDRLENLSDPDRLNWAKQNYATSMRLIGVTVPNIRPIVKDLSQHFQKSPPEEVIRFAKQLNSTRILEAQQIAIEVLDRHKKAQKSLTMNEIKEFGEGIDNWVSTDYFAGLLAGPAWRDGRIPDNVIHDWATSDDKWWRRAAIVSTVALNQKARGGSGDAGRTLRVCEIVAGDEDEIVAKGLSWALRELAKRDAAPVIEFLDKHESKLPKRVLREVRTKIDTGRKRA
jgi:3-methyladenine DNA glycosylase AlkD